MVIFYSPIAQFPNNSCNAGDPDSVIPGSGRSSGERTDHPLQYSWALLVAQIVKNPPAMVSAVGDLGLIPGLGRFPGEGNSYPLQYSGWENSRDCIVHGVTKNQTQLSDFHLMEKNPASRISLSLPQSNLPSKHLDVVTLQTQDGLLPKIAFEGQD